MSLSRYDMKNGGKISSRELRVAWQRVFPELSVVTAVATSRGLPQRHRPAARILALSCGAPVGKAN